MAHKHAYDCEQTSLEILEEWIAGSGKQPVTWNTLIDVLHDIELGTLAREVAAVKLPEGEYFEANLLERGDPDAESEASVSEDSDQSDGGEIPAEPITDIELNTRATKIEAVQLPADVEDTSTEDSVIEVFHDIELTALTELPTAHRKTPKSELEYCNRIPL